MPDVMSCNWRESVDCWRELLARAERETGSCPQLSFNSVVLILLPHLGNTVCCSVVCISAFRRMGLPQRSIVLSVIGHQKVEPGLEGIYLGSFSPITTCRDDLRKFGISVSAMLTRTPWPLMCVVCVESKLFLLFELDLGSYREAFKPS